MIYIPSTSVENTSITTTRYRNCIRGGFHTFIVVHIIRMYISVAGIRKLVLECGGGGGSRYSTEGGCDNIHAKENQTITAIRSQVLTVSPSRTSPPPPPKKSSDLRWPYIIVVLQSRPPTPERVKSPRSLQSPPRPAHTRRR